MPKRDVPTNPEPFDPSIIDLSTATKITESLNQIAIALGEGKITPGVARALAAVANTSLKAINVDVAEDIAELKAKFKDRDDEQRGPGRRRGTS